jgi:hypothetical protein
MSNATSSLSDGSINFLVTFAAIAFAIFGGTRATETLSLFCARDQDYRHLNSLSAMSVVIITASSMPLMLSDITNFVQLSSLLVCFIVSFFCIAEIWVISRKSRQILNKYSTAAILVVCILCAALLALNYYYFASITLYKSTIFLGTLALFYRFHLVLHAVIGRP